MGLLILVKLYYSHNSVLHISIIIIIIVVFNSNLHLPPCVGFPENEHMQFNPLSQ